MSDPVPAFPSSVIPPTGQRVAVVIHMPVSKDRILIGTYGGGRLYANHRVILGDWNTAAAKRLIGRWAPVGSLVGPVGSARHG